MEVVAVRIGSCRPRPSEPRHRVTWLSPRDATALLYAAATRPLTSRFLTLYGTSGNAERWWPRTGSGRYFTREGSTVSPASRS